MSELSHSLTEHELIINRYRQISEEKGFQMNRCGNNNYMFSKSYESLQPLLMTDLTLIRNNKCERIKWFKSEYLGHGIELRIDEQRKSITAIIKGEENITKPLNKILLHLNVLIQESNEDQIHDKI